MVDGHLLVAFVVTTAVAMIVPGPDMLFVLGCGIRGGPRAGLLATCGVATSETIHVALAAAGLTALFVAVPTAFTVVRIVGAAYLIYLGVQAIRGRGKFDVAEDAGQVGIQGRQAYVRGCMTNLLNPKMVTFTIALLPQFINPALGHVWVQFAILGAILVAFEFLVDGTVGVLAGRIGSVLRRRRAVRRGLDVTAGGIFIGLGVRLAVDQ
ncbi:LysE family translocator [Kribbella qitaiheensis]|uniref:LysE family translocator n=1 Tax=Kribbella qitaiheensis TaxID=1544730 RepID=A0A7G6X1W1_9ACTN|nr:LysE family translocator [Kribbella qitaiheensis]QNE20226.1 LysE family translocator [Kribbella qitaiheensis]